MTTLEKHTMSIIQVAKIFIIEDDAEIVNWVKMKIDTIENLHFSGAYFKYEGAFEKICEVKPDIVILDLRLSDGNGINILKKIRQENLNITILVFSMNVQAKNTCLKNGADYFFDKSKEADIFLERLKYINR